VGVANGTRPTTCAVVTDQRETPSPRVAITLDSLSGKELRSNQLASTLLQRCRFPTDTEELHCAVSGGADSLALLVLAILDGFRVHVIHVDHGLRSGSAREADLVADVAERFGATFESLTLTLADGPNLEARAREARYAVLPGNVATGHTCDDVAETVLLNLVRGSGIDGLAPLVGAGSGQLIRPLLSLRRSETMALCASLGLVPFSDPMNIDSRYRRVRMRTEVLPLLNDVAERDVVPLLARLADTVVEDIALLNALASEIDVESAADLAAASQPLARRAVRRWLTGVVGDGHPPSLATIDRVLAVARGEMARADLVDGWRVARTNQRLRLERINQG
jgi:tRNA(Ile)-lysidine synthase